MDIEKIWNESTWTKQARDIILNLKRFHKKAKIVLILRHSQRNEPKKFSTTADLNLTSQGRKVANLFGKKLPENKPIRLFYSGAERCRDTAEEIFKGYKENDGEVVIEGQFKPLSHIGIDLNFFLTENEKYDIIELLYRWIAGVYSPTLWPPLITYSQNAAEKMVEKVEKAPENVLDIHITHDLHL
ncbi:MAG: histidine phosphatase family protein, partial [Candidatus Thorarchaeota archaeon]